MRNLKILFHRLFAMKSFRVKYFEDKYSVPMDYTASKSYAGMFNGEVELIK